MRMLPPAGGNQLAAVAAAPVTFAGRGEWTMTVVAATDASVTVEHRLAFEDLKSSAWPADDLARARKDLAEGIYLQLRRDGGIERLRVRPGTTAGTSTMFLGLAGYTQLSLPARGSEKTWHADEMDASGVYQADYAVDPDNPGMLTRSRPSSKTPDAGKRQTATYDHRSAFILAADGWPQSISIVESAQLGGSDTMQVTSRVKAEHRLVDVDTDTARVGRFEELDASLVDGRSAIATLQKGHGRAQDRKIDQRRASGQSIDSLLGRLRAATGADNATKQRHDALSDLQALIRHDPKTIDGITTELVAKAPDNEAVFLLSGLSGAGVATASERLAEMIQTIDAGRPKLREAGAMLAGLASPATPKTVAGLTAFLAADDGHSKGSALLALGNQAKKLGATDEEAAQQAKDELFNRYESETDDGELATLILALGNAADSRALPIAQQLRSSANPRLRSASVYALRFIDRIEADAVIVEAMTTDPDASVRLQAIEATSVLSPSRPARLSQALFERIARDHDPSVRIAALRALGKVPSLHKELDAVLAQLRGSETDARVQRVVTALSARGG